jgi:hypothetical protein
MAVYKIFAQKDTTIYSDYGNMNTGMDAILELTKNSSLYHTSQSTAARILIKFSDDDINSIYSEIGAVPFKTFLRMYLADATALPTDYTIEAFNISGAWDMGTGRYGDIPTTSTGTTWIYKNSGLTNPWEISFDPGLTGSYTPGNEGGGLWYTNYKATQSFGVYTDKDIEMDVTSLVNEYITLAIKNEGFILKTADPLEFNEAYNYVLNFFSRDTNTVYPPVLEFRWDDSSYVQTTASVATSVSSQDIRVSIANNKAEYSQHEKYRFRLNVRDQFPTRTFSTSSLYTSPKALPSSSYYAVKDLKADLNVIDFSTEYTKISRDTNGNYFDINMYGLQPERYYKILIKTVISGSTVIFDDQYYFKVNE